MNAIRPQTAMVLAAGLGKRMRPLTAMVPKPLIEVAGRALIDHNLDRLAEAGVEKAVVNVHYLADLLEVHVRRRRRPQIVISDERAGLLDTGGAVVKALPELGTEPFYHVNSDSLWIEGPRPNLRWLAEAWDDARMDALLMLAPTVGSIGYSGRGDFAMDPAGRLTRRGERQVVPFVYASAAIFHPRFFDGAPKDAFSLNLLFDRAIEAERLYGVRMDGVWINVETPQALREAEHCFTESAA